MLVDRVAERILVTQVVSFSQSSKYEEPSRIRIIPFISTRSVVTSSPPIAMPGVNRA